MPLFTKPQFNSVWASSGSKLTPDSSKISQGWIVEIPPHEFENWSANRQDALLAHLNQVGIPMWDATVEYQAGKSYVQGTTSGVVYRALTTHTNINPEIDISNNWVVAFEANGSALLKSQNLADVPDKALARTNLGIATTEFYDGRYLVKNNNLGDVPNKATARNNLGLGNSATRDVGSVAGTVAAGDDQRIVNSVPNTRRIIPGAGMSASSGGDFSADRSISLGTPSYITKTSTNSVTGNTHSHAIDMNTFFQTREMDQNGYQIFPGGFCLQWGIVVGIPNDGSTVVPLKRTFSVAFGVVASAQSFNPFDPDPNEVGANIVSLNSIRVFNTSQTFAQNAHWIAFGLVEGF